VEYFSILISDLGLLEKTTAKRRGKDAGEIRRMISRLLATFPHLQLKDPPGKQSNWQLDAGSWKPTEV
jgi:hypothetical protein